MNRQTALCVFSVTVAWCLSFHTCTVTDDTQIHYVNTGIKLGDVFPNFEAETTVGNITFHDWLCDSWGILLSHPADYSPVSTTELAEASKRFAEFTKRDVKLIASSCDTVEDHKEWIQDILYLANESEFNFPIIADEKRDLAVRLGMMDPAEKEKEALPLTCRGMFIVGPDKKLKLSMLYPATTGWNFDEILRVVDSLQLTAEKKVATPVNWNSGDRCLVPLSTPGELNELFPISELLTVPSGKTYLRFTPQPSI